jgi:tetratricopeptide (TPR) repeat protein
VIAITLVSVMLLSAQAQGAAPLRQPPRAAASIPDRATLLQQAADAQRAGRNRDAAEILRVAAERYQSVQALVELARLQSRAGDVTAAVESMSKARTIAPNSEEVLSAYAQLSLAAKAPLPAVVTLQSLARVYPTVAQYHYLLGVGLMAVGDMPSAVDSLNEADRLEPDRALTQLALGLALNNRKMFAEAKKALSHSLELQADSPDAIAALAEAEIGLGDYDAAASHAQQAIDRAPANATANFSIAMVLMRRGEYAAARDALLKTAAQDPDSPKVAYQLSLVYARLGDEATAQRYVERYQENLRTVEKRVGALRGAKQ